MTETARNGTLVTPVAPRKQSDRMLVPDVLRGVAILAMLIAHAGRLVPERNGLGNFVLGNINDLASPLFALVMGMSTQITINRLAPGASARWIFVAQNTVRALILIILGLWLSEWGSWIAIVLSYLGVVLLVGAPILLLRTWAVATIAAIVLLLSEPVNALARTEWMPALGYDSALQDLLSWTFTGGSYRASNLLPFFLLGAILLRHGMKRDRHLLVMLVIGFVAYPLRPLAEQILGIEQPITGSYLDTLHDVGLVFTTYVIVVWLATVQSLTATRIIGAVFVPFRAIGSVALSLYVFQVGLVAWWAHNVDSSYTTNDWPRWMILVVGVSVVGYLWWRFVGKGPIEWLIGVVSGRYRVKAPQRE